MSPDKCWKHKQGLASWSYDKPQVLSCQRVRPFRLYKKHPEGVLQFFSYTWSPASDDPTWEFSHFTMPWTCYKFSRSHTWKQIWTFSQAHSLWSLHAGLRRSTAPSHMLLRSASTLEHTLVPVSRGTVFQIFASHCVYWTFTCVYSRDTQYFITERACVRWCSPPICGILSVLGAEGASVTGQ